MKNKQAKFLVMLLGGFYALIVILFTWPFILIRALRDAKKMHKKIEDNKEDYKIDTMITDYKKH